MAVRYAYDSGAIHLRKSTQRTAFARYDYDAYGNITSEQTFATSLLSFSQAQAISAAQPLRYAGYVWDAETKLYYCSARYYDPGTASFISRDPAKADGEKSPYMYCAGEPVGSVDLDGTSWTQKSLPVFAYKQISATCFYYALWAIIHYKKPSLAGGVNYLKRKLFSDSFSLLWWDRYLLKMKPFKIKSSYTKSVLSWKAVKKQIDSKSPILAGGFANSIRHAFTISGYKYQKTSHYVLIGTWGGKKWRNYEQLNTKKGISWDNYNHISWRSLSWYGFKNI